MTGQLLCRKRNLSAVDPSRKRTRRQVARGVFSLARFRPVFHSSNLPISVPHWLVRLFGVRRLDAALARPFFSLRTPRQPPCETPKPTQNESGVKPPHSKTATVRNAKAHAKRKRRQASALQNSHRAKRQSPRETKAASSLRTPKQPPRETPKRTQNESGVKPPHSKTATVRDAKADAKIPVVSTGCLIGAPVSALG
jgi:hypothetical protein